MNDYKEFTGKTLDEAIEEARNHYGVPRERLEIEIVSGGSTGIFGLVGVKKAMVKARPRANMGELLDLVRTVTEKLVSAIADDVSISVSLAEDRVRALLTTEGDASSLIGREGQTLAALQYLVNRIIARRWSEPVRVQLDLGEYREKQDDNLRKTALFLGDKAKTQGKPQSTKPLSSYHRRLVHLALQDDEEIVTRSKGEGPLKRVLILPKRLDRAADAEGRADEPSDESYDEYDED